MKDVLDSVEKCDQMSEVLTIGYEGTDIGSFIDRLCNAGIETLVDVRELPLSRKRGFSKTKLRAALEETGINYIHIKALGDPKEGRLAARSGDHRRFVEVFSAHMATDLAQKALTELVEIVRGAKTCLLCFEKCHTGCHRQIVADELAKQTEIQIRHITV